MSCWAAVCLTVGIAGAIDAPAPDCSDLWFAMAEDALHAETQAEMDAVWCEWMRRLDALNCHEGPWTRHIAERCD